MTDPQIAALVSSLVTSFMTGLFTWLGMRAKIAEARAQRAPDIQATVNDAVAKIIGHYKTALEDASREIAELKHAIEQQSSVISDLEEHVDALTEALRKANIDPPPRRKRAQA